MSNLMKWLEIQVCLEEAENEASPTVSPNTDRVQELPDVAGHTAMNINVNGNAEIGNTTSTSTASAFFESSVYVLVFVVVVGLLASKGIGIKHSWSFWGPARA
uniref:Uncharacterized protein n=1 Tax=Chromera velia CCMP2878 TaxID=1169474 RepID=A0A0G4HF47_9ALVE|eukprot:Cvel_6626.t1-p1 / transcript=Cvel_6626.t1 / gene=Cvel_6626 / organism=Chromera_velia_CCMP2878 / gene_product=hypothetical protein / transcript_product=hypothetical protein / location=Cvel_scaffold328:40163-40468(+) / protein_length=102 / sequence_SO=supercontig / SO=protein_coding / is_pseudo=false